MACRPMQLPRPDENLLWGVASGVGAGGIPRGLVAACVTGCWVAPLSLSPRSGPPRRGLPGFAVFGRDTRGESGSESVKFDFESLDVCFFVASFMRGFIRKANVFLTVKKILPLRIQGGQRRFSMVYFPAWPGAWGSGDQGARGVQGG